MKQIFTGIIFYDPQTNKRPRKYRNISHLENFLKFAQKEGGWYVNLYFKKDAKFSPRRYLRNDF